MSVLDDFVRMRLYRMRAAELKMAAEGSVSKSVRNRYFVAADDHYWQVADAEQQAERAATLSRLIHWNKAFNPDGRFTRASAHKIVFRHAPLLSADLTEEVVRILLRRAATYARQRTRTSQPNVHSEIEPNISKSQKSVPLSLSRSEKVLPKKVSARKPKLTPLGAAPDFHGFDAAWMIGAGRPSIKWPISARALSSL